MLRFFQSFIHVWYRENFLLISFNIIISLYCLYRRSRSGKPRQRNLTVRSSMGFIFSEIGSLDCSWALRGFGT